MKIAEWPPSSVNEINLKSPPGGFLPKILIQETKRKPCGSVEKLDYPRNVTSLQAVQPDTGQYGRPSRAESAKKRPVYLKENAPIKALLPNNLKSKGVWYKYTL